ncbi:DUF7713 domain-containing protein [Plebeiibacterium sediminum]|uniref:Uncharacterized protein n=1 Tax=Plebeiibacterium sediminum TaxID=2992112 RepID=A0AAE3M9Q2_9BACT|nr:hypothetical protein [Plebeiobacterium sediminum]MCW3789395.1 hypothetical protein [Plebeiobacterium sediminum]
MTTIITDPLKDGYDFFITDKWEKEYHFKIITFDVPSGKLSIAVEDAEETDNYYPRKMEVLSDYDVDIEAAELRLKAKVKNEINQKSLRMNDKGNFVVKDNSLQGVVLADWGMDISKPLFSVDGKKISAQQLSRLLSPYCSFKFRLEIIDPNE